MRRFIFYLRLWWKLRQVVKATDRWLNVVDPDGKKLKTQEYPF